MFLRGPCSVTFVYTSHKTLTLSCIARKHYMSICRRFPCLQGDTFISISWNISAWFDCFGKLVHQLCFYPAKCNIMKIHKCRPVCNSLYEFCRVALQEVDHAKYLGATISDNLKHIGKIARNANNTLNVLQRNLKYCPIHAKQAAYVSLVRCTLEYSCIVWDQYFLKETNIISFPRKNYYLYCWLIRGNRFWVACNTV